MTYVATINTPGYLPDGTEEPPTFDTAEAAWEYLTDERMRHEDETQEADEHAEPYSETVTELDRIRVLSHNGPEEGTVYGSTPGYDGSHDLGLAYSVTEL